MTFPDHPYADAAALADAYFDELAKAYASVDRAKLNAAAALMAGAYQAGRRIYVCGNGGSAAIADHLVCDHLKGCQTDTDLKPRVVSLANSLATVTALANDVSYDAVFSYQLRTLADAGDILVTISSSGTSPNIVAACQQGRDMGLKIIAMTGFSGGASADLADINLHVTSDNYGVIEDTHQSLMHILAQAIRLEAMDAALIPQRKF